MSKYERWVSEHIPRMDGKTVLITGANSGLGFEAAKLLAIRGAQLVLAVRNRDKGEGAVARIRAVAPDLRYTLLLLDLADLVSIGRFAENVRDAHSRLDVLVNNAGVMAIPRSSTADGFEMQFGTNHLGHFALTGLLCRPGNALSRWRCHCGPRTGISVPHGQRAGADPPGRARWRDAPPPRHALHAGTELVAGALPHPSGQRARPGAMRRRPWPIRPDRARALAGSAREYMAAMVPHAAPDDAIARAAAHVHDAIGAAARA